MGKNNNKIGVTLDFGSSTYTREGNTVQVQTFQRTFEHLVLNEFQNKNFRITVVKFDGTYIVQNPKLRTSESSRFAENDCCIVQTKNFRRKFDS